MSTRGTRFVSTISQGASDPVFLNCVFTVGIVGAAIYIYNLSSKKESYVSKRGIIANNIGQTKLNDEIGKKNHRANRMKKLFAGGKFDYSKNSFRDIKSSLYNR